MATQTGIDSNSSPVIDALGNLRVTLNNAIRMLCRQKSMDQKFIRDIFVRNTVSMSSGSGAVPENVYREFIHLGEFADTNNSLITYYNYGTDYGSGQNFNQLGYATIQGDNFLYTPPSGTSTSYSGNLYVTCPTFPTFPANMSSSITFPSTAFIDDLVLVLAQMITGKEV